MKKLFIFTFIIISFFMMSSCIGAGYSDWSYELPHEFELWHINSKEIKIVYVGDSPLIGTKGEKTLGIPSFVKEFAYNERYICTRNIVNIDENNINNEVYYILDTQNAVTYGPYDNINAFNEAMTEFNIADLGYWKRTSPDPNMN